jgi:hypothetical protein
LDHSTEGLRLHCVVWSLERWKLNASRSFISPANSFGIVADVADGRLDVLPSGSTVFCNAVAPFAESTQDS